MRPDLTTLKIFLSAVDERSMTRAAEREHITVPAVSKRITELETMLGVVLLERRSNGIRPTAAGLELAAEARDIFRSLDRMQGKLSEYANGQRGEVRLLCSPSGLVGSLPEHLKSFMLAHPLVTVQLDERRVSNVIKGITEGDADIGIFAYHGTAETLKAIQGLNIIPYQALRLVLVTPRNHPLNKKRRVSFAEAASYEFVGFSETSVVGALLRRVAKEHNLRYKSALVVTGFEALRRMVQAGLGIGVLPEFCALPYAKTMQLGCIPITDGWAGDKIDICTRAPDTLSMSARLMLAHLTRQPNGRQTSRPRHRQ